MLKFIKSYWLHIALIIGAAVYACIKFANYEWADGIVAVTLGVVTAGALLTRIDYDLLHEEHAQLVIDYIKELDSNLEFINKSKATLFDIMATIDDVKELPATPKKKRGRPKKA